MTTRTPLIAGILLLALASTGCQTLWHGGGYEKTRRGNSSSLVDYLYPNGAILAPPSNSLPYLELPLRVGIAFVPGGSGSGAQQSQLAASVAKAFADRPFVADIQVIPVTYLYSARGLTGMQQVASLFDVDIMALISHDQLALSGERESAILYWTIVGALAVKGNTNEVHTLVDTAVFDVATAKLLFRAPGTHQGAGNASMVNSARELRGLQQEGFEVAIDAMIQNLDTELERFKDEVKNGEHVEVAWKPGTSGGSLGVFGLCLLGLCAVRRIMRPIRVPAPAPIPLGLLPSPAGNSYRIGNDLEKLRGGARTCDDHNPGPGPISH